MGAHVREREDVPPSTYADAAATLKAGPGRCTWGKNDRYCGVETNGLFVLPYMV